MTIKKIQSLEADAMKHVAAYCRVSTQRDEQEESFETQKAIYISYLKYLILHVLYSAIIIFA